jgi:hypothetical protein
MHENSAAVAQQFTIKIPVVIRPLNSDIAVSYVEDVDLFIIC